jgi:hypothetical protein
MPTEANACGADNGELPRVKLGKCFYNVGDGKVREFRDSTAFRGDPSVLRARLAEDGYIFLRGVVPQDAVRVGRLAVLQHLDGQRLIDTSSGPLDTAIVAVTHDGDQGRVQGTDQLIRTPDFLGLVEHPALFQLAGDIFGESATTFDFKWLRAVKPGESSGFHMDSVYMYGGSPQLLTCWIPFQEVPWELGGLAVLGGSQASAGYKRIRETYGAIDMDRDNVGGTLWFTEDAEEALHFGGEFATAHFRPGDVVLFSMKTLHGSCVNQTNRWRISCDVRFQPKSEPVDTRWVMDESGEIPGLGSRWQKHRHDPVIYPTTMDEAKRKWGVHWRDVLTPEIAKSDASASGAEGQDDTRQAPSPVKRLRT